MYHNPLRIAAAAFSRQAEVAPPPKRARGKKAPGVAKRRRKPGKAARSPMRPEHVDLALAALIARPRAAQAALGFLEPRCFWKEPLHRLVWEVLLAAHADHGPGRVPYDVARAGVVERLAAAPAYFLPEARAAMLAEPGDVGRPIAEGEPGALVSRPGLLHRIYHEFRDDAAGGRAGFRILKRFLLERAVVDEILRLAVEDPADFGEAVQRTLARSRSIASLGQTRWYSLDATTTD